MGRLLAANALSIAFLIACAWFVYNGHPGFGVVCLIGVFLTAHTFENEA